ncbi:MAG TPA: N-acetyltransferase [Acidimicrobiia bacterium]|nr:N-acetyltransferase [Acidimicrobiia bacterium]
MKKPVTKTPVGLTLPSPPLTGESVVLRPWRTDDAPALVAAWADPEIRRWAEVPAETGLDAASIWITGQALRRERRMALDLAVVDADGSVVGEVGLSSFDERRGAALIGWWTAADARGRGVATEAVALLTGWALGGQLGLSVVVARVDAANVASLAVARRAGYSEVAGGGPDPQVTLVRRSGSPPP